VRAKLVWPPGDGVGEVFALNLKMTFRTWDRGEEMHIHRITRKLEEAAWRSVR
jgi:hypothetical protein